MTISPQGPCMEQEQTLSTTHQMDAAADARLPEGLHSQGQPAEPEDLVLSCCGSMQVLAEKQILMLDAPADRQDHNMISINGIGIIACKKVTLHDALDVYHEVIPENGVSEPAWPPHSVPRHCYAENSPHLQSLLLVAAPTYSTLLQQIWLMSSVLGKGMVKDTKEQQTETCIIVRMQIVTHFEVALRLMAEVRLLNPWHMQSHSCFQLLRMKDAEGREDDRAQVMRPASAHLL